LPLLRLAATRRYRVYFLGGAAGVGDRAVAQLRRQVPDLIVAGVDAPAVDVDRAPRAHEDIVARLVAARADLVLVDLTNPFMLPARDPLRSLVYTAADRAVHSVFVNGEKVVDAGRVLTLNHAEALGLLAEAQARMEANVPNHDWAHRRADQIAPLSLPVHE